MDNIFIILTTTFVIVMVLWLLYTVFFSLSENEKRKRKKKVKYVDRETIKKEKIKETKEIKEYEVKDMRKEKNIEKVSIVDTSEETKKETIDKTEENYSYENYMYDVLVERSEENTKTYYTEPKQENVQIVEKTAQRFVDYSEPEIMENENLKSSEPQKYYGQVQDTDYVKVVNKLKQMENKQNSHNESLASEFKNLSNEMKIYIIDNIIGNID